MKNKNKKPLIALLLVATLGVVGATFAYYTTTDTFENVFNSGAYKTEVKETFTSPSNWTPGTVTDKTVNVTNKGEVDAAVRVSFEEKWTGADGAALGLTDADGNKAALINFTTGYTNEWKESTEEGKVYYYYHKKLAPNEATTKSLIQSVEFNPAVDINATTNCTEAAGTKTCTSTLSGFAGATYTLTVKVETAQYDQYKNVWNTSVNI